MDNPATALTRHDEAHGHYTDRPTLHDQLTAGMHGVLVEMFGIRVGHTMGGDFLLAKDDAKVLARVAETILRQRTQTLEGAIDAIARIHGTYHAGPDHTAYCTGCGRAHPCPTRTEIDRVRA